MRPPCRRGGAAACAELVRQLAAALDKVQHLDVKGLRFMLGREVRGWTRRVSSGWMWPTMPSSGLGEPSSDYGIICGSQGEQGIS